MKGRVSESRQWARLVRPVSAFSLLFLFCAFSCNGGKDAPNPEDFTFRMIDEIPFDVAVQCAGSPVPHAHVQITSEDHHTESGVSEGGGSVYYRGVSDAQGRVMGVLLAPPTVERFSVVIQAAGFSGPYSDGALALELGHFGPSSQQIVSARGLTGMTVELTPDVTGAQLALGVIGPRPLPLPVPMPLPPVPPPVTDEDETGIIDEWNPVPTAVLTAVGDTLPEQSNAGVAFLSSTFNPNIHVLQPANVKLLFLHEGAGYLNSLGYFTYTIAEDGALTIQDSNLVWPNASLLNSGGQMEPGFTSFLRDDDGAVRLFEAGTYIGFFLVAGGWYGSAVRSWDGPGSLPHATALENGGSPGIYTSLEQLNPERVGAQPEMAKHIAVISMPAVSGFMGDQPYVLVGFEDLRRDGSSDDDFNDAVFVVQANPVEAIDTAEIFQLVDSDADGDGLEGLDDSFPSDDQRAWVDSYPSNGYYTLAYEDQYPHVGDGDFNDAVFLYRYDRVYRADGLVKDLIGTFHLVARGAGSDAAFALRLSQLPPGLAATIVVERISSEGNRSPLDSFDAEVDADGHLLVELLPSLIAALPAPEGEAFSNTIPGAVELPAASARVKVVFSQPIGADSMALPPYDPILLVRYGDVFYDIHLIGKAPLPERPVELPEESGPMSFLDDNFFPWALNLPFDWAFPREKVHIGGVVANDGAYPQFNTWRQSAGFSAMDWYRYPSDVINKVGPSGPSLIPSRTFEIGIY